MLDETVIVATVGYWRERSTKTKTVIYLTSREPIDKSSIKESLLGRNNNHHLSSGKICDGSFHGWIWNERVWRAQIYRFLVRRISLS